MCPTARDPPARDTPLGSRGTYPGRAHNPDNTKSGVTSPCFYDPDLNRTYQRFAEHYATAVVPARIRRPRDKAKAETGVQGVERWILARLRHRRFFSLGELNQAIRERFWALAQRMHGAYREAGLTAIEIEAALESKGEHAVEALVARAERR